MIGNRSSSTRAVVLAVIATLASAGVAAGNPPATTLASLSAARESAAPAAADATLKAAVSAAAPATPEKARQTSEHAEIEGLLHLGASLTDRADPDFEAAEIAYRQVLNSPNAEAADLKTALLGMAHMFRKHDDLTKAAAVYERYLADYPGDEHNPDALLELGRTLRDMGAYKLAIARFYSVINSTLKVTGRDFERYQLLAKTAQFEIAETHFDAGEYAEANKYFTKFRLLDVAPADRARAQFKAADALRREGKLDSAATALRAFIEQWPDNENIPEARYLLAITLRDLKRPQESLAAALDLLRAEKSRVAANPKRWLHWQLVTGNQLANEYFESGDIVTAHTIYSTLLELSPDVTWRLPITYQLGLCYERLGIMDRARGSYQSVLDLAGPKPKSEFLELTQMADWRLKHLAWREKASQQISAFFDSTTGKQASNASDTTQAAARP